MINLISKIFKPNKTKTVPPVLKVSTTSRQWRDIGHDVVAIAAVVFFATTTQCWYAMNFQSSHQEHSVPKTVVEEPASGTVVQHTLSCSALKTIYDKSYLAQLGERDDIDFLAIDKSFYETYGECL